MAYTKQHALPTGATVSHFRVMSYRVDYSAQEASALIAGYVNPTVQVPLCPIFAKLRLAGERFNAVLGKDVLRDSGDDINAALYKAMRTDPVVCDAGADFFVDALAS